MSKSKLNTELTRLYYALFELERELAFSDNSVDVANINKRMRSINKEVNEIKFQLEFLA